MFVSLRPWRGPAKSASTHVDTNPQFSEGGLTQSDLTAKRKKKKKVNAPPLYIYFQQMLTSECIEMFPSEGNHFKSLSFASVLQENNDRKKIIHQSNKMKDERNCVWHTVKSLLDDVQTDVLTRTRHCRAEQRLHCSFLSTEIARVAVSGALLEVMKCTQRSERHKIDYDFSVRAEGKKNPTLLAIPPQSCSILSTSEHFLPWIPDTGSPCNVPQGCCWKRKKPNTSHRRRHFSHLVPETGRYHTRGVGGSIGLMDGACRRQRWESGGGGGGSRVMRAHVSDGEGFFYLFFFKQGRPDPSSVLCWELPVWTNETWRKLPSRGGWRGGVVMFLSSCQSVPSGEHPPLGWQDLLLPSAGVQWDSMLCMRIRLYYCGNTLLNVFCWEFNNSI